MDSAGEILCAASHRTVLSESTLRFQRHKNLCEKKLTGFGSAWIYEHEFFGHKHSKLNTASQLTDESLQITNIHLL